MVNRRFLELAERLRNDSAPARKKFKATNGKSPPPLLMNPTGDPFLLQYDVFGKELIAKSNRTYAGTAAEIPDGTSGEVEQMYILRRLALITTLAGDRTLQSKGYWPITPAQSESYLQAGKLVTPEENWEELGLVLYDTSSDGENPYESKALAKSIREHARELGLDKKGLEKRLVVVHPGLKIDSSAPHGVVPIVLPGITQVYAHEVLAKAGEDPQFKGYGLTGGLPKISQLDDSGDRTLYLPDETEDIGLRVLVRDWDLDLDARDWNLTDDNADGRVHFAPQGTRKK
ncbi:MAG: hypothetical protein AABX23_04610 [Nanoarchaeota archaeon]